MKEVYAIYDFFMSFMQIDSIRYSWTIIYDLKWTYACIVYARYNSNFINYSHYAIASNLIIY